MKYLFGESVLSVVPDNDLFETEFRDNGDLEISKKLSIDNNAGYRLNIDGYTVGAEGNTSPIIFFRFSVIDMRTGKTLFTFNLRGEWYELNVINQFFSSYNYKTRFVEEWNNFRQAEEDKVEENAEVSCNS